MKKNVPRFLAWLLLLCGLAGGPVAARLGRTVPPGVLRWLVTAGAALMIISFFWFPRRVDGGVPEKHVAARRRRAKGTTAKARPQRQAHREAAEPEPVGRRARKQSQAAAAKRGKQ